MNIHTTLIASAILASCGSIASAATLSSLISGETLVQGDVTFGNFFFDDRFGNDETGVQSDREDIPFAGDQSVSASQIQVTTSATASSVTLMIALDPTISIMGSDQTTGSRHIYDFFLDFSVSISGTSTRKILSATLGEGDLFATGTGVSEIIYDIVDHDDANDLEIFEAPALVPMSATSDSESVTATSMMLLKGFIEGDTGVVSTAGLSRFSLTFDLQGTPPEPEVVPLPAGLPLLIGALSMLGLAGRMRRSA